MLNRKYCVFITYIQNVQVGYTKKHTFLHKFYRERWLLSQSHSVSSKDIHHNFFLLTLTPACLFLVSVPTVVLCMVSRSSAFVLYPQLGHCTSITLISFILSGLSVTTTSVRFPSLSRQASIRRFRKKPEVAGKRVLRALRPSRRNGGKNKFVVEKVSR